MGGPYLWGYETSLHRTDLTHKLGGGPEGGTYPDLECRFTNTHVGYIHCTDPYERLCPGGGPGGGANPDLTCQFAITLGAYMSALTRMSCWAQGLEEVHIRTLGIGLHTNGTQATYWPH